MKSDYQTGLVSAIIPVYNRPRLLIESVKSVLAQSYRPIEIIIVDDGSTDDTGAVVDNLQREHPEVIRVLHLENGGPGRAREAGRGIAQGEFIQYLDSDDLLLPRKFELQVNALREHPECGIAYGITRLIDADGKVLQEPYKLTGQKMNYLFPALLVERWWNTQTPLWRRTVCDRIGPWPQGKMGEDWVYDSKAAALRVPLVFVPEVVAATRRHGEGRLTRSGFSSDKSKDIACLVVALHEAASQSKVDPLCPEIQHFSRWAFLEARRAGSFGHIQEASACLAVAKKTAHTFDLKMTFVGCMAKVLGWKITGNICGLMEPVFSRSMVNKKSGFSRLPEFE